MTHLTDCASFWAWAVVGCVLAFGAVSLGPLLLVPAAILAFVLASRTSRGSAFGLLTGVGVLLLFVSYVNREGPGTTCWERGTASGCGEHLNPLPWLVLGLGLVVAGIGAFAVSRARQAPRH
jgi:hypothetical protein